MAQRESRRARSTKRGERAAGRHAAGDQHEVAPRKQLTPGDRGKGVWVYGVVPASAALEELERRDGLPEVWVIESGDLGAIVGDAPGDEAEAMGGQILVHARVLEAAIVDAAVVPLHPGVVMPGDEEVASQLLDPRHAELVRLLETLEGRVQLTVKVWYREDALLREIVHQLVEVRRDAAGGLLGTLEAAGALVESLTDHAPGVADLGLFRDQIDQRRRRDATQIMALLEPLSVAVATEPLQDESMVLHSAFLVARGRQREFERAAAHLVDERPMRSQVLGPMPAYNFLDAKDWC